MAEAFGGSRVQARPPERGIFPLDHEGECREAMKVGRSTPSCCFETFYAEYHSCGLI
jgi:hypothetical protein